jgi:hypothetical protein
MGAIAVALVIFVIFITPAIILLRGAKKELITYNTGRKEVRATGIRGGCGALFLVIGILIPAIIIAYKATGH